MSYRPQIYTFVKVFLVFVVFAYCNCQDFGYDDNDGPSHWGDKYSNCTGKHQSPIDFEEEQVTVVKFPPMHYNFFDVPIELVSIQNNGHTVQVSFIDGIRPKISGGPLNASYAFEQLHFHWGHNDTEGSENMLNHHSFPLELHIVFFKLEYNTFKDALAHDDGLVVLSFFYSLSDRDNAHYANFEQILENIHGVQASRQSHYFESLDRFTTKNRGTYYTYIGSLTTPPCSEVVTWIEYKHTIPLSSAQISAFRLLSTHGGHQITHNFRPTQPLNERIIYMHSGCEKIYKNIFSSLLFGLILFVIY